MKRSFVNLADKIFPVELVEGETLQEGLRHGILFRIIDEKTEEVMGCISAYVSLTTLAVWRNNWDKSVNESVVENIFIAIFPYLLIQENIHNIHNFYTNQAGKCLKVVIDANDPGYSFNENTMNVRGEENPEKLIQKLVYSGKLDDVKVEQEILKLLYNHWQESHNTKLLVPTIQELLLIPEKALIRNLDFLEQKKYIETIKTDLAMVSASISANGIEYVRSKFELAKSGDVIMGDQIIGDKITASSNGPNSPVVVKSNNINIDYTKIDNLQHEIDNNYSGDDKKELLENVKEIRSLADQPSNWSKARAILGGIVTRTSEIATIVAAALQVLQMFSGK